MESSVCVFFSVCNSHFHFTSLFLSHFFLLCQSSHCSALCSTCCIKHDWNIITVWHLQKITRRLFLNMSTTLNWWDFLWTEALSYSHAVDTSDACGASKCFCWCPRWWLKWWYSEPCLFVALQDNQCGIVTNIDIRCAVKLVGTNCVLYPVNSKDLQHIWVREYSFIE